LNKIEYIAEIKINIDEKSIMIDVPVSTLAANPILFKTLK
jgi:hypothetical protein